MRKIALPAIVLLLAAGCGTGLFTRKPDPIAMTATTAAIVGEQAVETNRQYVQLCAASAVPVEKCSAWRTWFQGFQRDYAAAHAAFKAAAAGGDITSAQDAAARLRSLSNELVLYYVYLGRR